MVILEVMWFSECHQLELVVFCYEVDLLGVILGILLVEVKMKQEGFTS